MIVHRAVLGTATVVLAAGSLASCGGQRGDTPNNTALTALRTAQTTLAAAPYVHVARPAGPELWLSQRLTVWRLGATESPARRVMMWATPRSLWVRAGSTGCYHRHADGARFAASDSQQARDASALPTADSAQLVHRDANGSLIVRVRAAGPHGRKTVSDVTIDARGRATLVRQHAASTKTKAGGWSHVTYSYPTAAQFGRGAGAPRSRICS